MCGAFHSLCESEIGQVLEEVGCVGMGEVLQMVVDVAKEDEGTGVKDGGAKSLMVLLKLALGSMEGSRRGCS